MQFIVPFVFDATAKVGEFAIAKLASVRFLTGVGSHVTTQLKIDHKSFAANTINMIDRKIINVCICFKSY